MSGGEGGGVRYNDRVLVLGDTGAGKSELINFYWELFRCQRLLLDSKDEFSVPDLTADVERDGQHPNLKPTRNVDDVDWSAPVIHYIPSHDSGKAGLVEMDDLFRAAYDSPHPLIVASHEVSDVCQYNANRTPPGFDTYVSKGRVRGKGLLAGSQLPVHMPIRAKALNQHVFVVVPRFIRTDDMREVSKMCGAEEREFSGQLDQMHEALGDHSFVHFDRRSRETVANLPLDDAARARITITRRDDA